jgi:hypothetical protein
LPFLLSLFYLSFFQAAVKFHLPCAAGRTFTVSAAAAAAASQGDPVNMAARKDEARCNDSQYGAGTDTHGYPSFLIFEVKGSEGSVRQRRTGSKGSEGGGGG